MKRAALMALATCVVCGFNPLARAAEQAASLQSGPPALNANPFSRPRDLASRRGPRPSESAAGSDGGRDLRAVLAGKNRGMANLGGELVETGSQYDGYLLVRIERDAAIFKRDGAEIRLEIGEDLPDE